MLGSRLGFLAPRTHGGLFSASASRSISPGFRATCHDYEYMDLTRQSVRAQNQHSTYLAGKEKTCIDCHKGIVHRLPNMAGKV